MILGPDFSEFVALCERHEVRYLIVGGFAVGVHGHIRYTKDLDIWVEPETSNVSDLLRVPDELGFGSLDLSADDFLIPGNVVQLGYPPNRLDLLTQPTGVKFTTCWANRLRIDLGTVTANVMGLDDLVANKRATGRLRDLADIEDLGRA